MSSEALTARNREGHPKDGSIMLPKLYFAPSALGNVVNSTWSDGPGRGPQPSISAGVRDFYISRLWRWEAKF